MLCKKPDGWIHAVDHYAEIWGVASLAVDAGNAHRTVVGGMLMYCRAYAPRMNTVGCPVCQGPHYAARRW